MELQQRHIDALDKAETLMFHHDFCPYLELKQLLPNTAPEARNRFRSLFTNYYGLNVGGLTDAFKDRFFEILFGVKVITNGQPDISAILNELSLFPGRRGYCAMPFSFVSKLAAVHQETRPLYDRHILNFFGMKAPAASVAKAKRISWFLDFLNTVAGDYGVWAQNERIIPIIDRLKARDQQLAQCHAIRLVDFLVWKVGNQKLLQTHESN